MSSTSCGEVVAAGKAATAVPDLPVVAPEGVTDAQEPPATRCRHVTDLAALDAFAEASTDHASDALT